MQKINNLSNSDYIKVQGIIEKSRLSYYEIKKEDFLCYKNNNVIISFWRIFNIWCDYYEI